MAEHSHPRRGQWARRAAPIGMVAAALVGGACASEPSPAEARDERVRERLEATFSGAQVDCILDAVDAPTRDALDATATLASDSDELAAYSEAVNACVTGATTTTSEAATTTAPPDEGE